MAAPGAIRVVAPGSAFRDAMLAIEPRENGGLRPSLLPERLRVDEVCREYEAMFQQVANA
jgi:hypothetical protein